MLDFRMETFLTVCNDMNFTHAAEHLNLTQPAVSQHIKHLEKTYGTELFIRDKKKLRLTPAGEILRSALETMRNDENTLKKRMQESLKGKKVLTFGVTMTIGEYAIVPALSRFVKTHPDMDFHIRYGNTQTLLTYLCEGTIDFAIVEGYFSGDHYETRIYKAEEYIAVASADHTFAKLCSQPERPDIRTSFDSGTRFRNQGNPDQDTGIEKYVCQRLPTSCGNRKHPHDRHSVKRRLWNFFSL